MDPVISLREVSKRYGAETALDKVSFEVPRGTVFALLGENGAGKTTAIRIMLGLAQADAGQADVLGLSRAKQGLEIRQPRRLRGGAAHALRMDDRRRDRLVHRRLLRPDFLPEYLRLADKFRLPPGRKIKALSKGMRAKVALSLALANGPELLVLDEPTSGLDAAGPPRIPGEHGRSRRARARRCFSPAIRSAKSSAWPTSWPSSARASCCWSSAWTS